MEVPAPTANREELGAGASVVVAGVGAGTDTGASFSFFSRNKVRSAQPIAMTKLQNVGTMLERRIVEVGNKQQAARDQATHLYSIGQRSSAIRSFKRSKAFEKQAAALSDAATAVARQSDMLEDAGLQREVANALSAGVKGMRGAHLALKDVESVADKAADMRDVAEDVNTALASLTEGYDDGCADDDDLLSELAGMAEESPSPPAASATALPRLQQLDQTLESFPSAPMSKVVGAPSVAGEGLCAQ